MIHPEKISLIAQTCTLRSRVPCSVMSPNHSVLGASSEKSHCTKSSWADGSVFLALPRLGFSLNLENRPLVEQICHAITQLSPPLYPRPRGQSRHPDSGSSRCALSHPFALYASNSSEPVRGTYHLPVMLMTIVLQISAHNRDANPTRGQLAHERVYPFPDRFTCKKHTASRRSTSLSCCNNRLRLRSFPNSADSTVVVSGRGPRP